MSNTVRCPDCGGAGQELSATGSSTDCPNCDGKGLISNIPDDIMARVLLAEESDHTPAALPPAEALGDTNLTQPSGEQPTSVERDYNLIDLCNCDGFWHTASTLEKPSQYLEDLVAEERRQAKIEELEVLDYIPDNLGTKVWAQDVYDHIKKRLKELEGENNE